MLRKIWTLSSRCRYVYIHNILPEFQEVQSFPEVQPCPLIRNLDLREVSQDVVSDQGREVGKPCAMKSVTRSGQTPPGSMESVGVWQGVRGMTVTPFWQLYLNFLSRVLLILQKEKDLSFNSVSPFILHALFLFTSKCSDRIHSFFRSSFYFLYFYFHHAGATLTSLASDSLMVKLRVTFQYFSSFISLLGLIQLTPPTLRNSSLGPTWQHPLALSFLSGCGFSPSSLEPLPLPEPCQVQMWPYSPGSCTLIGWPLFLDLSFSCHLRRNKYHLYIFSQFQPKSVSQALYPDITMLIRGFTLDIFLLIQCIKKCTQDFSLLCVPLQVKMVFPYLFFQQIFTV